MLCTCKTIYSLLVTSHTVPYLHYYKALFAGVPHSITFGCPFLDLNLLLHSVLCTLSLITHYHTPFPD